ncbi:hypothetical protein IFT48_03355 [Pseudomonas fluorescens]|uniref:hypothetical protein n=1 Tax=Pseudomonas TaxID=286 RepID=UPI000F03A2BE|nr:MULTISPECIES: hypothetical protein [Pseudomonas]MBD8089006.1 hypothetical protein [Pseudomonas fluorescens]MBD8615562.1 hypothetical protein [Pseudomonas putida]MBD8681786.1 hypothetical protein [Pseudomonas sp. CFBP 13719]
MHAKLLINPEGFPDTALLADPDRLLALVTSPAYFESVAGVSHVLREVDADGNVSYSPLIDFAWRTHCKAAKAWVEQITELYSMMAKTQADLLEDNLAFARNLKGSKETTGATYDLLVRQRDGLAEQLTRARPEQASGDALS